MSQKKKKKEKKEKEKSKENNNIAITTTTTQNHKKKRYKYELKYKNTIIQQVEILMIDNTKEQAIAIIEEKEGMPAGTIQKWMRHSNHLEITQLMH